MKKLLFTLITIVGFIYLLQTPLTLKDTSVPPLGKLLNPFSGFWRNGAVARLDKSKNINASFPFSRPVDIVYDNRAVPHIYATSIKDAYFAQGYVTAKERLWQMDFSTRAAAGRLSEILGDQLLDYDKTKRRRGMTYGAQQAIAGWKKEPRFYNLLLAYIEGVNAYINELTPAKYPLEYKLMNFKPEQWTPLKTALFMMSMSETLASSTRDLEATNTIHKIGEEEFNTIFPSYFKEQLPIIPDWKAYIDMSEQTLEAIDSIPDVDVEFVSEQHSIKQDAGSNNWAIGPQKSKNGYPILCGDPHLPLNLPSIWYEIHISAPDMNVYGVSLPGIPSVIIGFNEYIAWSQTNVGHDVSDLYTITWRDKSKQQYLLDGKYEAIKPVIETYKVKKGSRYKIVTDTVKYTVWGPIVHEASEEGGKDVALRWGVHDEPANNELKAFVLLNQARNYEEYKNAIQYYEKPAQNFVFAATNGDIGLHVQGKLPIKGEHQGRFVQDGSKSSNAWKGAIPFEHLPHEYNPPRGFVSSANQHSTTPDYPYYYNSENFEAYRGRYLYQQLDKITTADRADMMQLQNSSYSIRPQEGLPLLLTQVEKMDLSEAEQKIVEQLKKWNYTFNKNDITPTYFEIWLHEFHKATWDELNEKDLDPKFWQTIFYLKDNPKGKFFDYIGTEKIETAADIALSSLKTTMHKADSLAANNQLQWYKYQNTSINHLARIAAFSRTNVPTNGYRKALNAISHRHGPSWRMVVELSKPVKAWVVYPGGQSGHVGSPYYDNFINTWANGEYYEAIFNQSATDFKETEILSTVTLD